MKTLKDILQKLFLVTCSILLALVLLEFGVRALGLYKFPADKFIKPHPKLGWSHIPNKEGYWTVGKDRVHVRINSKGLRDREYPYEKGKGTFRILVLGDSFTEGFQVPQKDTFCKVLERELNRTQPNRTQIDFEVINAGFAGVGTDYELLFFRREGYKYDPDLVIMAFFQNDVCDNYKSKAILDSKEAPLVYEKKGFIAHIKKFLAQNSCAYNYIGYSLPAHFPLPAKILMKIGLISSQPIGDIGGVDHVHYQVLAQEYGPELEKAWDVTRLLISELKNETECHGAKLAAISIPFREQVYEDLLESYFSGFGTGKREWDVNKPDRILSTFLDDEAIPFLQLFPDFKKAAETTPLYYGLDADVQDGHWNANGHYLAGQIIRDWLVINNLVPVDRER